MHINISDRKGKVFLMNTTAGLVIIGALVAILLWQKMSPVPVAPSNVPDPIVIDDGPIYAYPVTYTSSPWRIPAYSYGSVNNYRRFHQPNATRAWTPRVTRISHMRSPPAPVTRPFVPLPHPSAIPRIAMSHPIRSSGTRSR